MRLHVIHKLLEFFSRKIQETRLTEEVFRVNLINPGVEYEFPTSDLSTLSTGLGVGYSGVIDELTVSKKTGFKYIIAPFLEVQHKLFYNLNKRKRKDKSIVNNSGNFITAGLQAKGHRLQIMLNELQITISPLV